MINGLAQQAESLERLTSQIKGVMDSVQEAKRRVGFVAKYCPNPSAQAVGCRTLERELSNAADQLKDILGTD
jgi:hypothetical protein